LGQGEIPYRQYSLRPQKIFVLTRFNSLTDGYSPDEKRIWGEVLPRYLLVRPYRILKGRIFMDKNIKQKQPIFTTKTLTGMAIFTALAFVTYCIVPEIVIFPAADFLKLDFSNVFIILAGFMYGPIPAVIITVVKEVLHLPFGTTLGVGELANIIMTTAYIIFPTIMYRYKKGLKAVVLCLIVACVIQIAVSLLVNRFINFPFFIWLYKIPASPSAFFEMYWWYVLLFNLIKSISVSFLTILLYKRIKFLFKAINIMEK